ncbi:hypothetical protein DRN73_07700 [Candidatus Pacearchaeota archaeon]|nr:MAG: hypothetical protein DRN73_07700 [Candidatus Pacearchaeota archaeon]
MKEREIKIREFHEGDVNEIFSIHKENEDFFENFIFDKNFILEISQRNDFKFFVVEVSGSIVGFSGVLFHQSFGRAEIGPIALREEFKKKDIGKKLLMHTIEFLKMKGIRRVTAKIKVKKKVAIDFFKKFGFEKEGYFKEYTKNREDVVQMVKFLL